MGRLLVCLLCPAVLFASLFIVPLLKAAPSSCQGAETDRTTVVSPDTVGSYPGQFEGSSTSFYRVGRVVGPGIAQEYNSDGSLVFATTYFNNNVLTREACVGFNLTVTLNRQYYYWVQTQYMYLGTILPTAFAFGTSVPLGGVALPLTFQDGLIYQGSTPVKLPLRVQVSFNGRNLWERTLQLPVQEAGYQYGTRVRVPLPDASLIRFARLSSNRGGGACPIPGGVGSGEENCPALNKLVFRYSVPDVFESIGIGLSAPGVTVFGRGSALSFSAMPPIYLATGCCGSTDTAFWNNPELPYTAIQSMLINKLPHSISSTIPAVPGTIAVGGGVLADRVTSFSKMFGSKWLHILAHSKGGLNSRHALGTRVLEQRGIGVSSLVTLNTPHLGALGADLIEQVALGRMLKFDLGPLDSLLAEKITSQSIQDDRQFGTQRDLTTSALRTFNGNAMFATPPGTTRVGRLVRPITVRTVITDSNADGSQENQDVIASQSTYGWRDISQTEARGLAPGQLASVQSWAATVLYNLTGRSNGVNVTREWASTRYWVRPTPHNGSFLFNDSVVTVKSQSYGGHPNFLPLQSTLSPSAVQLNAPRGLAGAHHGSVSNGAIADSLAAFYRDLR